MKRDESYKSKKSQCEIQHFLHPLTPHTNLRFVQGCIGCLLVRDLSVIFKNCLLSTVYNFGYVNSKGVSHKKKYKKNKTFIGVWPSGKASEFGSGIQRFESFLPSIKDNQSILTSHTNLRFVTQTFQRSLYYHPY